MTAMTGYQLTCLCVGCFCAGGTFGVLLMILIARWIGRGQ